MTAPLQKVRGQRVPGVSLRKRTLVEVSGSKRIEREAPGFPGELLTGE